MRKYGAGGGAGRRVKADVPASMLARSARVESTQQERSPAGAGSRKKVATAREHAPARGRGCVPVNACGGALDQDRHVHGHNSTGGPHSPNVDRAIRPASRIRAIVGPGPGQRRPAVRGCLAFTACRRSSAAQHTTVSRGCKKNARERQRSTALIPTGHRGWTVASGGKLQRLTASVR